MALNKFGRNYILTVQTDSGAAGKSLTIQMPFTIEFDITRNTLSSANVCQIRVYNLSEYNRDQIRFNVYDYGNISRNVTLLAGYGNSLTTVFTGNITQAWSVREGVNFITQIECFDGGFAFVNGRTNQSFPAGTPYKKVITEIMKDLPGVTVGTVGNYPGVLSRGNTYSGDTVTLLSQLTGNGFFIDKGVANALGTKETLALPSGRLLINSDSGLLQTPVREQTKLSFEMIFEPSLNVGTLIQLESDTESSYNGPYKINTVKHRGMISGAVCGSAITSADFFLISDAPGG